MAARLTRGTGQKIDLDLTNATLVDFDLSKCHLHRARFNGAQFHGGARFDWARFIGDAQFYGAQFSGLALFYWAQFSGYTWFDGAQFNREAHFEVTRFSDYTQFARAQFAHDVSFEDARARVDIFESVEHSWPDGWLLQVPGNAEEGQLPGQEGTWGFLVRTTTDTEQAQ